MDDEYDDALANPDANWPTAGSSRLNWTDGAVMAFAAVEATGMAITAWAQLGGSILRAHSNYIGEKQAFARDAGLAIEAMSERG